MCWSVSITASSRVAEPKLMYFLSAVLYKYLFKNLSVIEVKTLPSSLIILFLQAPQLTAHWPRLWWIYQIYYVGFPPECFSKTVDEMKGLKQWIQDFPGGPAAKTLGSQSTSPDQGTRCRMLQRRPSAAKSINGYIYLNLKYTMLFFFFKDLFLHVNKNCEKSGAVVSFSG